MKLEMNENNVSNSTDVPFRRSCLTFPLSHVKLFLLRLGYKLYESIICNIIPFFFLPPLHYSLTTQTIVYYTLMIFNRPWAKNYFFGTCNDGAKNICAVDLIGYLRKMACMKCPDICSPHCVHVSMPRRLYTTNLERINGLVVQRATIGWMLEAYPYVRKRLL